MLRHFAATLIAAIASAQTDCSYFGNLGCSSGSATTNPPDWAERSFQTFLPGSPNYKPEYEGLGRVMCYNNIQYSADRSSATVEARCRTHSSIKSVAYNWNNAGFVNSNTFKADGSLGTNALPLTVKTIDNDGIEYSINLEPLHFVWQAATIN
jgi:hypothetical protein